MLNSESNSSKFCFHVIVKEALTALQGTWANTEHKLSQCRHSGCDGDNPR
jgi:hypothetical protein